MSIFDGLPIPKDKSYLREELSRIDESWVAARFDSLPHVVHILTSKNREGEVKVLKEQSDIIEEVVDEVVHAYHGGFNKAIQNYSQVPSPSDSDTDQITPICKLNLGYKADKVPIAKLKWADTDRKSSRLYVLGSSDFNSSNLLQVVLLNEHTETQTIKLGLHLPEALVDLEVTRSSIDQNKHRHDSLILLGRSSHVYTYDDSSIERYLVQSHNKSSPSLPKEVMIKSPYGDSSITTAKLITSTPCMPCHAEEDFNMLVKNILPLFPLERSVKEGNNSSSTSFTLSSFLFSRFLLSLNLLATFFLLSISCKYINDLSFKQVMMRLFVIRDKTRTPLENLEPVLREDIQKIWDVVPKSEAHKETPLSEFFNVEVVALSSFEKKEEQFREQVHAVA